MAVHDTFVISEHYKENHHKFLTVASAPEVPRQILEQILAITEQELYDYMVAGVGVKRTVAAEQEGAWLRYKATILRKVLATPGDFSFLKYSRSAAAPYWLLNVMYSAVATIDAWGYLRTHLAGIDSQTLLSQTPTVAQIQKLINAAGVFYNSDEFAGALKIMVYIAKNGWRRYLWR